MQHTTIFLKRVIIPFILILAFIQASAQQTIDYTYDDAGNMNQRTVIILSPMMADTTENDHSHPDPDMGSTAQVAESSSEETANAEESVTTRTGRYSFNLYPNPTHGLVKVEADASFMELEGKQVHIFDLAGRKLYSRPVDEERFTLDFSDYADGSYIVRITAERYVHEVKIVVSKK